jgi:hypothetical protein
MPHHVARMVVGHSPQPDGHVTSACGGAVWRVDVGMSRGTLKSAPQALEILPGGKVRVLMHDTSANAAQTPPPRANAQPQQPKSKAGGDKLRENVHRHEKVVLAHVHSAIVPPPAALVRGDRPRENVLMQEKVVLAHIHCGIVPPPAAGI